MRISASQPSRCRYSGLLYCALAILCSAFAVEILVITTACIFPGVQVTEIMVVSWQDSLQYHTCRQLQCWMPKWQPPFHYKARHHRRILGRTQQAILQRSGHACWLRGTPKLLELPLPVPQQVPCQSGASLLDFCQLCDQHKCCPSGGRYYEGSGPPPPRGGTHHPPLTEVNLTISVVQR